MKQKAEWVKDSVVEWVKVMGMGKDGKVMGKDGRVMEKDMVDGRVMEKEIREKGKEAVTKEHVGSAAKWDTRRWSAGRR